MSPFVDERCSQSFFALMDKEMSVKKHDIQREHMSLERTKQDNVRNLKDQLIKYNNFLIQLIEKHIIYRKKSTLKISLHISKLT